MSEIPGAPEKYCDKCGRLIPATAEMDRPRLHCEKCLIAGNFETPRVAFRRKAGWVDESQTNFFDGPTILID